MNIEANHATLAGHTFDNFNHIFSLFWYKLIDLYYLYHLSVSLDNNILVLISLLFLREALIYISPKASLLFLSFLYLFASL